MNEASPLSALLEETQGVIGVVLGTAGGEVRAVIGSVANEDAGAAAAAVTRELAAVGLLLGLGEFVVASLKAPTAARVFSRQSGAVLAIELDPKRPLGELETKLRTLAWAPADLSGPPANRPPAPSLRDRMLGAPRPSAPLPPTVRSLTMRPSSRADKPTRPLARSESAPIDIPSVPSVLKPVGSGPVFTGDLEEFAIPDLLEFLRNSQRTGLLMCTTSTGIGTVQLSRGMIVGADSPHALDLRQHFLNNPELALEQRRAIAALPAESFSDSTVDNVIGARDLVPRDEVERARVARIYSAFREMIGWTSGRFSFDPGVPIVTSTALALSAQSILMQICQEQDEQAR